MRKTFLVAIAVLMLAGFGCSGKGTSPGAQQEPAQPEQPRRPDLTKPVEYDLDEIDVVTERRVALLRQIFDAETLAARSEECGTSHGEEYYKELLLKFRNQRGTTYHFIYDGPSLQPNFYDVTLLPNEPGYETMEEFKRDFDVCSDDGWIYPLDVNDLWLVFERPCAAAEDDGSGNPKGCEEIRARFGKSLKIQ